MVTKYLEKSNLLPYLEKLGFNIVGYGCTTCIGNSGDMIKEVQNIIINNNLTIASVLSGNRNFEARIHPNIKMNFLMSPMFVVIYSLVGKINFNVLKEEIGKDKNGKSIFLKDLWPSSKEVEKYKTLKFNKFDLENELQHLATNLNMGIDIFEKALGYGKEDVLKQQVLLAFVNLIFTFIAMATVDKFGRKPLVYIGSLGMLIGFLLLGITIQQQAIGVLSLLGVLIFIGSFALSMGPVVWVLLSEMFPNKIRSIAMSVAVAVQWGGNYIVSQSFPIVTASEINNNVFWNGSLPYFIFSAFIIVIIIFTYKFIPETKGKSLEEIEEIWEK